MYTEFSLKEKDPYTISCYLSVIFLFIRDLPCFSVVNKRFSLCVRFNRT